MPRNLSFEPKHVPFKGKHASLRITKASGPFSFLNPTRAHIWHPSTTPSVSHSPDKDAAFRTTSTDAPIQYQWRSRDNRKGRHTMLVAPHIAKSSSSTDYVTPPSTKSPGQVLLNIRRMVTSFPVYDISYLVALIFIWGSVIWVINAFFSWLPLVDPSTEFTGETADGGGWTAFVGATVFEVGSWLLIVEAVNENREGCFGWAVEHVARRRKEGKEEDRVGSGSRDKQHEDSIDVEKDANKTVVRVMPDKELCAHHHLNRKNLVGKSKNTESNSTNSWTWFPSLESLRTHYLHELGFLACFSQFIGATIFWIAGFTAIPGVVPAGYQHLLDGVYWAPQVVGGTGFIISGTLFMLETQRAWYVPALKTLGWHIGIWNLIGGIGFTLCGALGFSTGTGEVYQASLATFWGSWAFLIGSLLQLYESLSKWSVEIADA